ncbi:MAG: AAA family ATPase [Sedimenticola sp.]
MAELNSLQHSALKMAEEGHNFVLLGSAGTGKSFVIGKIVESLNKMGKNVALTCSTGIACHVYEASLKVISNW